MVYIHAGHTRAELSLATIKHIHALLGFGLLPLNLTSRHHTSVGTPNDQANNSPNSTVGTLLVWDLPVTMHTNSLKLTVDTLLVWDFPVIRHINPLNILLTQLVWDFPVVRQTIHPAPRLAQLVWDFPVIKQTIHPTFF
jgi:hypothetical protein